MKSLSLYIIIALFDIEKYANLLKPNLITFQKFISLFSSDSYLHAPLIIRCEVHLSSFYGKYEGMPLSVLLEVFSNKYFRAWKLQ
nr:MAG TPA: hypothetical protein [Caudoviricetes sp.]